MPAPARRLPILALVLVAGLASLAFAPQLSADAPGATVSWQPFGLTVDDVVTIKVSGGPNQSSGLFRFFTRDNWELLVKVLDGCTVNGRFWVFVAAATSVEYTLRIEDLATGAVWVGSNPLGRLSPSHADIEAFDTCEA